MGKDVFPTTPPPTMAKLYPALTFTGWEYPRAYG